MRFLSADNADDLAEWAAIWQLTSHREPQSHPAYAVTMAPPESATWCAFYTSSCGSALLPFHTRSVPDEYGWSDAITPYGYGGPYVEGVVDEIDFWRKWDFWGRENRIVSMVLRRHLFADELVPIGGIETSPLDNIYVDLRRTPDEIWDSFEGRARTDVRRAVKSGVTVERDEDCSSLEQFHSIYIETMERNNAADYYLFELPQLRRMVDELGSAAVIFNAHQEGRTVASEIQLVGGINSYYFLSGTTLGGRSCRASSLTRFEAIKWLHEKKKSRYVLGGGMGHDDPLFKYKKAYSPKSSIPFVIGYRAIRPDVADQFLANRATREPGWVPAGNYYPAYRAPRVS